MDALERAAEGAVPVLANADASLDTAYALCLFQTLLGKIRLIHSLRASYAAQDRRAIEELRIQALPALIQSYEALTVAHRALWESNSKRQGWEVLALRYGGAVGRLRDVADALARYADGRLTGIPELDETPLPDGKGFSYDQVSTPSAKT